MVHHVVRVDVIGNNSQTNRRVQKHLARFWKELEND